MYELIELNNKESVGQKEVGNKHNFHFDGSQFRFGTIISSRVESIFSDAFQMTVKTRNSLYRFKRIT